MNRPSLLWKFYIAAFYVFLFAPLLVVAVFAFHEGDRVVHEPQLLLWGHLSETHEATPPN